MAEDGQQRAGGVNSHSLPTLAVDDKHKGAAGEGVAQHTEVLPLEHLGDDLTEQSPYLLVVGPRGDLPSDLVDLPRIVSEEAGERHEEGPQLVAVAGVAQCTPPTGEEQVPQGWVSLRQRLRPIGHSSQRRVLRPLSEKCHRLRCSVNAPKVLAIAEEFGHILGGDDPLLQPLVQGRQSQADVHDVAAHLLDGEDHPPVHLLPQLHPAPQRVLLREQAQHGEDAVGRLEVVQEQVASAGRVVGLHPVVMATIYRTPVAASTPLSGSKQHLSASQVSGGIS